MRIRPLVAGSGILLAGLVGLTHLDRLRSIPANLRRYSMPSATTYDLATRLVYGTRYDEIAAAIAAEAPAGGAVLDVGSGSGEVLLRLARRVPTLRLTGVDVDPGMLAVAERKAARLPAASRPTFVAADAASLPMDDASVDLVVSSFAAHHLPDRHAALAEMMRVLKPGGRVIIWDIASPVAPPRRAGRRPCGRHPWAAPGRVDARPCRPLAARHPADDDPVRTAAGGALRVRQARRVIGARCADAPLDRVGWPLGPSVCEHASHGRDRVGAEPGGEPGSPGMRRRIGEVGRRPPAEPARDQPAGGSR